jgi:hypothetical protein
VRDRGGCLHGFEDLVFEAASALPRTPDLSGDVFSSSASFSLRVVVLRVVGLRFFVPVGLEALGGEAAQRLLIPGEEQGNIRTFSLLLPGSRAMDDGYVRHTSAVESCRLRPT